MREFFAHSVAMLARPVICNAILSAEHEFDEFLWSITTFHVCSLEFSKMEAKTRFFDPDKKFEIVQMVAYNTSRYMFWEKSTDPT